MTGIFASAKVTRGGAAMVVGVLRIRLYVRSSRSLKEKRQVVRRLKDRLANRFPVSVAEVGDADDLKLVQLGVATVSADSAFANSVLDGVTRLVESLYPREFSSAERDLLRPDL